MTGEREVHFLDALAHARALIESGVPLEGALAGAPADLRDELAEALRAIGRVQALEAAPAHAFTSALEGRLLAAVDEVRATRMRRRGFFAGPLLWRLGAAAAAVVLAFAVSGFAAVQASNSAIPGDALYPVKEATENVRVLFARGDSRIARAYLDRLAARQRELEVALDRDAPVDVILKLERGVVTTATAIVQVSVRVRDAGDPRPADLAASALADLHARLEGRAAAEGRPAVALTLRRMSNFLEGQERDLRGEAPAEPQPPQDERRQPRSGEATPLRARPSVSPTPQRVRPR